VLAVAAVSIVLIACFPECMIMMGILAEPEIGAAVGVATTIGVAEEPQIEEGIEVILEEAEAIASKSAIPSSSGVTRVWSSTEPHVADVANAIEEFSPGRVLDLEQDIYEIATKSKYSDFDILGDNFVIEVTSAPGGKLRQIEKLLKVANYGNLRLALYAPKYGGHAAASILKNTRVPVFREIEQVIEWIETH